MTDTFRSPTIGAVCVLYGMAQVPAILVDLARGGVEVSIVDNSGDLASDGAKHAGVRVATPGLNLGYSKGVNRALAGLTSHPDVVLVVNPDIVGDPEALVAFAGRSRLLTDHSWPLRRGAGATTASCPERPCGWS